MSEAAEKLPRMNVEEFIAWADGRPGRYELCDGEVVTMQAERQLHNRTKLSVAIAFRRALAGRRTGCRTFTDGITVRVDHETAFEPDAVIDCGARADTSIFADRPVVIAEVASPSTSRIDETRKFIGYFSVASVQHYLIIDARKRLVIHHRRDGETIVSRILNANQEGDATLTFDPPNISVAIAELFADPEAE